MRYRILGSCVTRDAFAVSSDPRLSLERYFARSSIASAFGPGPVTGVDTATITSPFQRRIVQWDLDKEFARSLSTGSFDRIVLDLIDERFDLVRTPTGALATRSNEFRAAATTADLERVASGSEEFFRLWCEGWRAFLATLDATVGRHVVLLHEAHWATTTESGAAFAHHPPEAIDAANALLDRLHAVIRADLSPTQVITPPRTAVVGADRHQWGPSPFHYADEYYRQLTALLVDRGVGAATPAGVRVAASRGTPLRTPRHVGFHFDPRADTDRYILDATVQERRASSIHLTYRLDGWTAVRYVAIGWMEGTRFWRVLLPHDVTHGVRSVTLGLASLTDASGAAGEAQALVGTLRVYVSGEPSAQGAAVELHELSLG